VLYCEPSARFWIGAVVPEMIGTRLDRFELIAELASGGMGAIFLARLGGAGGFQRLYAIKRLHEHLARHTEFIEMFLDEARLAARIHHPNVVPILEIGMTDAGYYLVMEYVEGDTAGHLFRCAALEGKPVNHRVAVRIALDVLAGLHAAHEGTDDEGHPLEIVHRDVSPHNILVSVDGVSRITDFGIARAAARLAVTRSGQLKGKIAYMAPEQARSEKIDRRADVFCLGICLWEMLAQKRLFRTDAEGETLNRLLYEPIPSLRSVDPAISPALDAVCMKALSRDLEHRFATAAEFSDALEHAARSLDLVGTHRDVALCMADVLGEDLSERRADLRAWLTEPGRRSLAPPDSRGDPDVERPGGAMVSAYVPPLFDAGTLGAHAESSQPSGPRARRRSKGLVVATLAAMTLAGSVGGASWLHARAQDSAVSGAPGRTAAINPKPAEMPSVTPPAAPAEAASALLPIDATPALSPPAATNARSMAPTPPTAGLAGAARSIHAAPGSSPTPDAASASPHPAASVPSDMLYNPYR
jgi:tRNA A-37 threonylcarbamoyl transferase component Bud32